MKNQDAELWHDRARQAWHRMTENERHGVRFGLIPSWAAEEYGANKFDPEGDSVRLFALALYGVAERNGGMSA